MTKKICVTVGVELTVLLMEENELHKSKRTSSISCETDSYFILKLILISLSAL